MSENTNANFLHTIKAPSLNSADYANGIAKAFENIDANFKTLANQDFVKGETGKSIKIVDVLLYDATKNDVETPYTYLSEYGCKIVDSILNTYDGNKLNDININGNTITFVDYLKDKDAKILMICDEEQDEYVSSMYYIFYDARFNNEYLGTLTSEQLKQYDELVDASCVLVYNGETSEFDVLTNTFPTLYYQQGTGFCWKINGKETGMPIQGIEGRPGKDKDLRFQIVKTSQSKFNEGKYEITDIFVYYEGMKDANYWYSTTQTDINISDYNNCSALICVENNGKINYYFGLLGYENNTLYGYLDINYPINATFITQDFINIMSKIDIDNNGNTDATQGLKGYFIPFNVKDFNNNKSAHLITATHNDDKNNKNVLLLQPVGDVFAESITKTNETAKLKIDYNETVVNNLLVSNLFKVVDDNTNDSVISIGKDKPTYTAAPIEIWRNDNISNTEPYLKISSAEYGKTNKNALSIYPNQIIHTNSGSTEYSKINFSGTNGITINSNVGNIAINSAQGINVKSENLNIDVDSKTNEVSYYTCFKESIKTDNKTSDNDIAVSGIIYEYKPKFEYNNCVLCIDKDTNELLKTNYDGFGSSKLYVKTNIKMPSSSEYESAVYAIIPDGISIGKDENGRPIPILKITHRSYEPTKNVTHEINIVDYLRDLPLNDENTSFIASNLYLIKIGNDYINDKHFMNISIIATQLNNADGTCSENVLPYNAFELQFDTKNNKYILHTGATDKEKPGIKCCDILYFKNKSINNGTSPNTPILTVDSINVINTNSFTTSSEITNTKDGDDGWYWYRNDDYADKKIPKYEFSHDDSNVNDNIISEFDDYVKNYNVFFGEKNNNTFFETKTTTNNNINYYQILKYAPNITEKNISCYGDKIYINNVTEPLTIVNNDGPKHIKRINNILKNKTYVGLVDEKNNIYGPITDDENKYNTHNTFVALFAIYNNKYYNDETNISEPINKFYLLKSAPKSDNEESVDGKKYNISAIETPGIQTNYIKTNDIPVYIDGSVTIAGDIKYTGTLDKVGGTSSSSLDLPKNSTQSQSLQPFCDFENGFSAFSENIAYLVDRLVEDGKIDYVNATHSETFANGFLSINITDGYIKVSGMLSSPYVMGPVVIGYKAKFVVDEYITSIEVVNPDTAIKNMITDEYIHVDNYIVTE